MRSCKSLKGGLQDVADELRVARIGPQHQAGSDSLLTLNTFFKMRSKFFEDEIDPKYIGNLYGLGSSSGAFVNSNNNGSGSSGAGGKDNTTPQMMPGHVLTPGSALTLPLPSAASAALPIKDPFMPSPFKPS